VETLVEKVSFR